MHSPFTITTIHSFKGGSGKSTISINFAKILSEMGNRVLLIENDLIMPTYTQIFKRYWKNEPPTHFWNHYLTVGKKETLEEIVVETSLNFDIICTDPAFNPNDHSLFVDKKKFRDWLITLQKLKTRLKDSNKYDIVIFDSPPGWSFLVINNLIISDSVILVSRLNKFEVFGTQKMIEDIYLKTRSWTDNLFLIWNQVPRVDEDKLNSLITKFECDLRKNDKSVITKFARIPLNDHYAYKAALGDTILNDKDSLLLRNLMKTIVTDFFSHST